MQTTPPLATAPTDHAIDRATDRAPGQDPGRDIALALVRGALHEVWCHGKPGLVCPDTSGAHTDMDIWTFMAAIPSLCAAFDAAARQGLAHRGAATALFRGLRAKGPAWERDLLAATRGVNTHRGLLFLGSLTGAAAGTVVRDGLPLHAETVCLRVAGLCLGLCDAELHDAPPRQEPGRSPTAGERLYAAHGLTGIRGEAEAGLPTVLTHGLPALEEALDRGADLERSLLHALVAIMAGAWDTTVAHRGGIEGLVWLRGEARRMVRCGGALTDQGMHLLAACRARCLTRRISPGGAADLLALTIALYLLERGGWPEHANTNREERWLL